MEAKSEIDNAQNFIKTEKKYLENTYLFENSSKLLGMGTDNRGSFLVFESTVFHPQGGGQPADTGRIEDDGHTPLAEVTFVDLNSDGVIRHYCKYLVDEQVIREKIGTFLHQIIDQEKRISNAKSHTAGHLIGGIVETLEPKLEKLKSYHFPEGPNIEFKGKETTHERAVLASKIEEIAAQVIKTGAAVTVTSDSSLESGKTRFIHIEGFSPIPCGGTHLKNINELKSLKIRKINVSNGSLKVCYSYE